MKEVILASLFFMLALPTSDAKFTPLKIDNHPCTAENLKVIFEKRAITYILFLTGVIFPEKYPIHLHIQWDSPLSNGMGMAKK